MTAVVIGLGNRCREDDGVGIEVARTLAAMDIPGVAVEIGPGDVVELIEAWDGARLAVVIDAARSGARPGTVARVDLRGDNIAAAGLRSSTHGLGLADAVALGRVLGRLPARLVIIAVEGERFGHGERLSPAIRASLGAAVGAVVGELRCSPAAGAWVRRR